jgi:hypothetical protein
VTKWQHLVLAVLKLIVLPSEGWFSLAGTLAFTVKWKCAV